MSEQTITPLVEEPVVTPPVETPPVETPPPRFDHSIWDDKEPGKFREKWQEQLPEDYSEHKDMLAQYGDLKTLASAFKEHMTAARSKGWIKPLTDKSTPEDVADFRKKMGIPETPYEFAKPEKLPDGVLWQDERVKEFGAFARDNNLTEKQAQALLQKHLEYLSQDTATWQQQEQALMQERKQRDQEVLKMTFGGTLPSTVNKAQRVGLMPEYNIPPEAFDPESPVFAGPAVLKMAADLFEMRGESKVPSAAFVLNHHHDPMREAQAIQTDEGHPMHAKWAAGDATVMKHLQNLYAQATKQREGK